MSRYQRSLSHSPAYTPVRVRLSTGTITMRDISKTMYHNACIEDAGIDKSTCVPDSANIEPFSLNRNGNDFICKNCGAIVVHILNEEEEWEASIISQLHFTSQGILSHKIGSSKWSLVKQYFTYYSYAELEEAAEDQDNFDEAESYTGRRDGEWFINNVSEIPIVEELLGILPHNRRAVLDISEREAAEREKAERIESARIAKERIDGKALHFDCTRGEYPQIIQDGFDGHVRGVRIKWEEGFNIYGSGQEFMVDEDGQHVWLLINNGMDGDNWSRNNVHTGGAGAIGYRFEATPERLAYLRTLPGGEKVGLTQKELTKTATTNALSRLHEIAVANIPETFAGLFVALPTSSARLLSIWSFRAQCQFNSVNLAPGIGMTPDGKNIIVAVACRYGTFEDAKLEGSNGTAWLRYEPTKDLVAAIKATWPTWIATPETPGRYHIPGSSNNYAENGAEALRIAACWDMPASEITVTKDVFVLYMNGQTAFWSDGISTGRHYSMARDRMQVIEKDAKNQVILDAGNKPSYPGEYSINNLEYWNKRDRDYLNAGFPPIPLNVPIASELPAAAHYLIKIAVKQPEFLAITETGLRAWEQLLHVVNTSKTVIDKFEYNRASSEIYGQISQISATYDDGRVETFWIVTDGWWTMGEDGDTDETTHIYTSEIDARADYAVVKSSSRSSY